MNILILRSIDNGTAKDDYSVRMNSSYADRVIGHLSDRGAFCFSCADLCIKCRASYDLDFSESITAVIEFPAVLPAILDDPEEFLPEKVHSHDILIAISVHEEILISFIQKFSEFKGIIVPIEETDWISPYAVNKIIEICNEKGIECAFPKPFCSFDPQEGVLARFRKEFSIGKPDMDFRIHSGMVADVRVISSAPCGATYYVARNLKNTWVGEELLLRGDLLLSAYPCTAGHSVDREFNDSITHQAVKVQHGMLKELHQGCLNKSIPFSAGEKETQDVSVKI